MGVVPKDVPGIVFYQADKAMKDAAQNLNDMNKGQVKPWELSFLLAEDFSKRRIKCADGQLDDSAHSAAAQKALFKSAQQCSLAEMR